MYNSIQLKTVGKDIYKGMWNQQKVEFALKN